MRNKKENNEIRLCAAEIITQLYEAKEVGQLQMLLMQCSLSVKSLSPDDFGKFIRHAFQSLPED